MDRHVVVGVVVGVDAIDMPCMPVWIEALYTACDHWMRSSSRGPRCNRDSCHAHAS
jgi:hypothetical protein